MNYSLRKKQQKQKTLVYNTTVTIGFALKMV